MENAIWKWVYGVAGFVGLAFAVWGHEAYLLTFVNPFLLIPVCLAPTVGFFVLIRRHYCRLYKTNKNYLPFLQSFLSVGLLTTSLFLVLNHQLASDETTTKTFDILDVGELGGKNRKPYAIITNGNLSKRLVFKRNPSIEPTAKVKLTTSTGLLGFEVIISQEVVN